MGHPRQRRCETVDRLSITLEPGGNGKAGCAWSRGNRTRRIPIISSFCQRSRTVVGASKFEGPVDLRRHKQSTYSGRSSQLFDYPKPSRGKQILKLRRSSLRSSLNFVKRRADFNRRNSRSLRRFEPRITLARGNGERVFFQFGGGIH